MPINSLTFTPSIMSLYLKRYYFYVLSLPVITTKYVN